MSVQWSERPTNPILPFPSPFGIEMTDASAPGILNDGGSTSNSGSDGFDTISRMLQQFEQNTQGMPPIGPMGFFDMLSSMFNQAGSAFGQLFGGGSPNYGSEQYYSSASGGSDGDPHLSFNGSTWNDMNSEPDLLHSDSIRGGYQLSTQTTTPNANGVTYNQSATVTTHNGGAQVTLNNNGNATITQNGLTTNLSPGQTVDMGNESVTRNQDGSLQVTSTNKNGGQITTTLRSNGPGIDVNVSARNVDLGGAMVQGPNASSSSPTVQLPAAPGRPVVRRYEENPVPFE